MKIKGAFPVRWAAQDGQPGTGVTIVQTTTRYAKSTSGTTRPTSGWQTSVPDVPDGQYLWTWVYVRYSDGTETNAYSVARMGIDGRGILSSSVTYSQQATSVDPTTITNWGAFPSTLTDGYWLYTKTHIVYSDNESTDSYSVSQVGVGSYYAGCQEYWAKGSSDVTPPEGAPTAGTYVNGQTIPISGTWSQNRVQTTADEPYLWNFEVSADSRGNRYVTQAICIGNFAKGIVSIVESYAISAYGSAESGRSYPSDIAAGDWTDEQNAAAPTEAKRYQWNRTVVTYNDGSQDTHYHVSAVKGIDGKGAVYIDLDNENDSMLYDGQGTLVSGSVTSNIALYANGGKVASPPTFSIKEKSAAVTASISGSVLTVSGCTASSGYVIVKCTYQDTEYTARFTVKRLVGTDKYEIILSHNAVTHNTDTDVLSVTTIGVSVFRTAQNGTRGKVTSLGTYGLTLMGYPNGLLINTFSPTYNSTSGLFEFDIDGDWDSVDIALIKNGAELDRESVPIGKVKNGPQGEGAMRLDLDNENDTMLYDGTNTTCLSGNVTSQATLYQGTNAIASGITWSCETTNCTASISTGGLVTVTAMSSSSGSVTVSAQYGGVTYSAVLTLKKIRGNDKYELVCTPNAITYNSDTGELSSGTITVSVYKTDVAGVRENISTLPSGFSLDVTNGSISKEYSNKWATIKLNEGYNYSDVTIRLKQNNLILDVETIPLCKVENGEGSPGANAKSIYKNSFEKPATPTGATPWTASGTIWSENPVEDTLIPITQQGDWIKEEDGYMRAPAIGSNQSTTQTIQFVTTESNQVIHIRAKSSTSSYAKLYIGKVDKTQPTASGNYERVISGTSQDTGDIALTIANAGQHFICICYTRGGNYAADKYAKFIIGQRPIWRSDAKTYNSAGAIATWTTPVKMSGSGSDEAPQMRANLILQSSFLATRMDQWIKKNGVTTNGLDGRNGYKGVPDYAADYKELIAQNMYDPNGDQRLLANTWYTLSFWAKADPYIQIDKYLTNYSYGFATETCYLEGGVECELTINGYCSSAAISAGKELRVFVFLEDWSWSTSVAIMATSSTSKSVKFTPPSTGLYKINSYAYPSGATSSQTVTINWYRINRGMRLVTYLWPTGGTQSTYTAMDTTAGRIKDGEFITGTPTDNNAEWQLSEVWTRHTLTFKTKSSIPASIQQLLFKMHQASNNVYVCMPKLEQGTMATAFCTNDNDVADRAADETGFPNPRGIWVEAPEDPFAWNETRRDYVYYEVDGEWRAFFVKRKGMVVPNGVAPVSGGNSYWEQGNVVSTLLSNTIIGTNCNIGGFLVSNQVFKSQNEKLILNGLLGVIQMFHDEGYTWQVLEDGRQVLGSYTSDTDKGQHIQIDPSTKEIRIYDDDGSCVTRINGETISTITDLFGNTSGNLTLGTYKTGSAGASNGGLNTIDHYTTATRKVCDFQTDSTTRLKFNGSLSATGSRTWVAVGSTSTDRPSQVVPPQSIVENGQYSIDNWAVVTIRIKTYSDANRTNLLTTKIVATVNSQRSSTGYGTHSASMTNLAVDLSAGYHTLEVYYYAIVYAGQTQTTNVTCSWSITSVSFVSDTYISRLFANGMAYGSSANNFFTAMNVDGTMVLKAVTRRNNAENNGFELSQRGMSIVCGDSLLRPVITLGFGRVKCTQSGNTYTDTLEAFSTCIRNHVTSPSVYRYTQNDRAYHRINFPSEWTNLGLSANDLYVNAVAYYDAKDHNYTCSVKTITTTYCEIVIGDDTSPNDLMNFWFEVKYMLP